MTNPSLYLTLKKRTEEEAREELAAKLDAEAEFWESARERQTYGPFTPYTEIIEKVRARAASLREKG